MISQIRIVDRLLNLSCILLVRIFQQSIHISKLRLFILYRRGFEVNISLRAYAPYLWRWMSSFSAIIVLTGKARDVLVLTSSIFGAIW